MATNFDVLNGIFGGFQSFDFNRGVASLFAVSGAGGDGAPPIATLVSPAANAFIGPSTPIVVETTDNVLLGRVFLVARMPGVALEELIYQGTRFTPPYAALSTKTTISGGFRFTVIRSAGWPSSPTIDAYLVDSSGTTE